MTTTAAIQATRPLIARSRSEPEWAVIVFVLTDNSLHEGGRPRDPLETVLNVNTEKADYLGDQDFDCETDDGERFGAHIGGTNFKNFRSRPIKALGAWLKARCRAMPGDEVHASWKEDGVLGLRYVRKYAAPDGATAEQRRLERETEDAICAQLEQHGETVRRQVRVTGGVADVLTAGVLYEIKTFLTRDDMLKGVGQLFVYRADPAVGPDKRLVLIGRPTRETAALIPVLAEIGVEVETWKG